MFEAAEDGLEEAPPSDAKEDELMSWAGGIGDAEIEDTVGVVAGELALLE